jgi:hypothetical protein
VCRANKQGLYLGIVACVLVTGYALLTSTPIAVGAEKKLPLDMGNYNFTHHTYMLGVYSHIVLQSVMITTDWDLLLSPDICMKKRKIRKAIFTSLIIACCSFLLIVDDAISQNREFAELKRFNAEAARQGVAVDSNHIYVIGTVQIAKYEKRTNVQVASWTANDKTPLIHLDSGVIVEGELFCAHSNYPEIPMTSSVEVWDAETLQHIASHSFGIRWGSCTWIDRYDGFWWGVFANYEKLKPKTGKGTSWTTLVKFDDEWRALAAWVFPEEIVQQVIPMSNSGGSWGPDGFLYCTGHDYEEIYIFTLPEVGSVLELADTAQIPIWGQGIAWDRSDPGVIYGIRKKERQVVIAKLQKWSVKKPGSEALF